MEYIKKDPNSLKTKAEEILDKSNLSPDEMQKCAALEAELRELGNQLYRNIETQREAIELFQLAENFRKKFNLKKGNNVWDEQIIDIGHGKFEEKIGDIEISPYLISNYIAARLAITLNGKEAVKMDGLRIGLVIGNPDDKRIGKNRTFEVFCKTNIADTDELSPKKRRAYFRRKIELEKYMDQKVKNIFGEDKEEGRIYLTTENTGIDIDMTNGIFPLPGAEFIEEELKIYDPKKIDNEKMSIPDIIKTNTEHILRLINECDYGNYIPHLVGSVRGGERKRKK